ncbi:hydroxyacid dehydrogenase [Candidatus Woesearchaeota archaeon]|nr:hydroxyacid dehydrogenase [Candidatus Woesearchaeota archaeon]
MRIAFFEISGWEEPILKNRLRGHSVKCFKEPLSLENASKARKCDAISVFIYSKITKPVLDLLPKVKMITTRSTGFDHLDLGACEKRGVCVCNVPFYGENTVAEHTFALILSLSRNIHKSYMRTLKNDYSIEGLKGFDLKGRTLGVVGAGKIGLHVIRVAKGFGMNVLAFDMNHDTFMSEVLGFKYASLEEVLAGSDIVTLHVPYNKHTHHLINKKNTRLFRKGSLLINTSRGAVVETDALLEALEKGMLAGAGLDVIEGEELIKEEKEILHKSGVCGAYERILKDKAILQMDNVVFTPHIAFYSQEALERILETTIDNIIGFSCQKPRNVVKHE